MSNYAGVDWAADKHDVLVADEAGEELLAATFAHDEKGLRALCRALVRLKVKLVAIERPDGLLVERLLDAGLRVLALHPNQVAATRARFRVSGGKSDRFDAFVLADVLRTDRARLRPLIPDSPATVALRQACRARTDLVHHSGRGDQPVARSPALCVSRCGRLVQQARLGHQPGVPGPLRLPGPGRLAVGETAGRLAESRRLQRPHRPSCVVSAADIGAAGRHR